jgi:predicted RNA binding protein YcfA (HicA-like mRNA interferase family)
MPRIGSTHWKEFEKFVIFVGCKFQREKGDHRIYTKNGLKRPVVFSRDTAMPEFVILNNLRVLGISREKYLEIIKKL